MVSSNCQYVFFPEVLWQDSGNRTQGTLAGGDSRKCLIVIYSVRKTPQVFLRSLDRDCLTKNCKVFHLNINSLPFKIRLRH